MLGLSSSLVKGGASLLTFVKDNLKLYLDFTSNKSDTLKFPSEGSTSFDGVDDYIDCGNNSSVQITGALSISSWIKTDNNSKYMFLVNKNDNTNVCYYSEVFNNGQLFFRIVSGGTNYEVGNTANTQIADGNWHHYCCVFEPSTSLKIYIDGELKQTNTTSIPATIDNDTVDLEIGRRGDNSNYFEGQMTNVGLWSRALSPEEIQSIMNKSYSQLKGVETTSLVSWWALDTAPDTLGNNLITNGTFDSDLSSWSTSSSHWQWDNGRAYAYSGSNYQFRTSSVISWTTGATYNVSFDIEWVSGSSLSFYLDGTLTTITSDTTSVNQNVVHTSGAGYFQIYNNGSVVYIDNIVVKELKIKDSESTNHGSVTGATTTTSVYGGNAPILPRAVDVAKEGQADAIGDGSASFNGSTDYIDLGDTDLFSFGNSSNDHAFSISAWINPIDATNFPIFSKMGDSNLEYTFEITSSDKLWLVLYDDVVSANERRLSSSTISQNVWTHVCATYDGRGGTSACDGINLYINGVLDQDAGSGFGTYTAMHNQNLPATIGFNDYANTYADGSISQLGIWKGELTQAQIQSVMESTSYSKIPADVKSTLSQRITNGSFDTDSDWGKGDGWSINATNGTASADGTGGFDYLSQSNIFDDANALYKMTITIDSAEDLVNSGIVKNGSVTNFYYGFGITSIGTHTVYFTNTTTGLSVYSNGVTITISNISIEKVTNDIVAYYSLGGSSSRANGTDDVTTGEVLGSEIFPTSNSVYTVNDYYQKDSANPPNLTYLNTDTGTVTINNSDLEESINRSATYKLTFTISGLTSGQANLKAVSVNFGRTYVDETMLDNGIHTFYFTRIAGGGDGFLFRSDTASGSTFTISDYSLKRVTSNTGVLK